MRLIFKKHFLTKQWRWKLIAGNNKIVAASSESFKRYKACEDNARLTASGLKYELLRIGKDE